ncbi:MAG: HAMP domain-containing histidine kinase [Flavobacteriia bacterium]|nr:HAMP domain-containing histidine kinase [Flavobacteriia bacterium]
MRSSILVWLCGLSFAITGQPTNNPWIHGYDWFWFSESEKGATSLLTNISSVGDTVYLTTPTGIFYSTNGIDWKQDSRVGQASGIVNVIPWKESIALEGVNHLFHIPDGELIGENLLAIGDSWAVYSIDSTDTAIPKHRRNCILVYNQDTIFLESNVQWIRYLENGVFFIYPYADNVDSPSPFLINGTNGARVFIQGVPIEQQSLQYAKSENLHFFLIGSNLVKVKVDTSNFLSTKVEVMPVRAGTTLHQFHSTVATVFEDEMTILKGELSVDQKNAMRYFEIESILELNGMLFAISDSRGVAYLRPNGIERIIPSGATRNQVDGLFKRDNHIYAVNWALNYPNSFPHDGEIRLRFDHDVYFDEHNSTFAFRSPFYSDSHLAKASDSYSNYLFFPYKVLQITPESDSTFLFVGSDDPSKIYSLYRFNTIQKRIQLLYNTSKSLYRFGRYDSELMWLGFEDSVVFVDASFKRVESSEVRMTRDVTFVSEDEWIISAYGQGMFFRSEDGALAPITFNSSRVSLHISETGFQRGIFYCFSNKGIFYQDSALALDQIRNNLPLFLIKESSIETNGGLFSTSVRLDSARRMIATIAGAVVWRLPTLSVVNEGVPFKNRARIIQSLESSHGQAFMQSDYFYLLSDEEEEIWHSSSSIELTDDNYEKWVFYFYDGHGNVQVYLTDSPEGVGYTVYLLLAVLCVGIIISIFYVYKSRKALSLQKLSLEYGWRPITNEDSHQREIMLLQLLDHDVNGSMHMILNSLNYVKLKASKESGVLLEECKSMISGVQQSIRHRVDELINPEEGKQVELVSVIESALNEVKPYASKKRITILNENKLNRSISNSEVLNRALTIVLGNAIKFSKASSTVIITTSSRGPSLFIDVIDNGIGLPSGQGYDEIPTQRTGVSGEHGMGVSLKIISRLLLKYNHSISLSNRDDSRGTVVRITWSLDSD